MTLTQLKEYISAMIYENNDRKISGTVLSSIFQLIIDISKEEINGQIIENNTQVQLAPITPTSPAPTIVSGIWFVTVAGTYANFGGVTLPPNTFGLILKNNTSYIIQTVQLPSIAIDGAITINQITKAVNGDTTVKYIQNKAVVNFDTNFSTGIGYDLGAKVFYNDKLYKSLKAVNKDLPSVVVSWQLINQEFKLDEDGGASSFELAIGKKSFKDSLKDSQYMDYEKINPPLTSSYYSYNSVTQEIKDNQFASFKTAKFDVEKNSVIKIKTGQFYLQNNANKINPLLIHIKDVDGNVVYFSTGQSETGRPTPPQGADVATGVFEFEKDIDVKSTVYVSCAYDAGGGVFDIYVKNAISGDFRVVNTSMANVVGGYQVYNPNAIENNPYNGKKLAILGDSISELGGVNAPTTSKYWYEYLKDYLSINYKTYAKSGNQWTDMLTQAQEAKAFQTANNIEYDLIILFAGTNDFYFNTQIGEWYTQVGNVRTLNFNTTTFKGRINSTLSYCKKTFPKAQILVCNILHRGKFQNVADEFTANSIGVFLDEYSKCIDEASIKWSIPLINLRGESTLYPIVEMGDFFTSATDLLHPNAKGHQRIGQLIKSRLLGLSIDIN